VIVPDADVRVVVRDLAKMIDGSNEYERAPEPDNGVLFLTATGLFDSSSCGFGTYGTLYRTILSGGMCKR
jgi:hypothetical protein